MTDQQNTKDLIRATSKQKLASQIKLKKEMTNGINPVSRQQQFDSMKNQTEDSNFQKNDSNK